MKATGRNRRVLIPLLCLTAAVLLSGCGTRIYESVAVPQAVTEEDSPAPEEGQAASDSGKPEKTKDGTEGHEEPADTDICVYICGAVKKPGVYVMPEGSRIFQLLEKAGGLSADADPVFLNQAELLTDGEQVTVYTREETAEIPQPARTSGDVPAAAGNSGSPDTRININTADAETLQQLNGIGASRAQDIISYRETNGGFGAIEDIMKVSGIKNALFEKIKDDITVG